MGHLKTLNSLNNHLKILNLEPSISTKPWILSTKPASTSRILSTSTSRPLPVCSIAATTTKSRSFSKIEQITGRVLETVGGKKTKTKARATETNCRSFNSSGQNASRVR